HPLCVRERERERECVCVCRSEEHTSELQSHLNLVCRLLLENKKHVVGRLTAVVAVMCADCITAHVTHTAASSLLRTLPPQIASATAAMDTFSGASQRL